MEIPVPQTEPKKLKRSKTVKTRFGSVDRKALDRLRGSYDTTVLLTAVDAIDQVRYCDDDLRESTLAVHGMAMNLINDNYAAPGGAVPDEPIWEVADRIAGDLLECIAHLEKAYEAISPLVELMPDPDDFDPPDDWPPQ
jgi:hypothetical protein